MGMIDTNSGWRFGGAGGSIQTSNIKNSSALIYSSLIERSIGDICVLFPWYGLILHAF